MPNNDVKFLGIGFSNLVNANKVIAIMAAGGTTSKRIANIAREAGELLDLTCGRKTRSVIMLEDRTVILSALNPVTLQQRAESDEEE